MSGPQFAHRVTDPGASKFHGAIADTEPDGWARRVIRRDHATRRKAAKARGEDMDAMVTALDFLLAVDDASRVDTKGEVLGLQLARHAGINVAAARLVDSDGVPVALVRRFDRVRDPLTGAERRLLFVSAATLMTIAPGDKGEHAYTEIADVIRQRSADSAADLEELW